MYFVKILIKINHFIEFWYLHHDLYHTGKIKIQAFKFIWCNKYLRIDQVLFESFELFD